MSHKYLHLFHKSLAEFNRLFPDQQGLFGVRFDTADPGSAVKKVHAVAKQRSDKVSHVTEVYKTATVPLAFIAHLTGDTPIDAWYGLMQLEIPFHVCAGTAPERKVAYDALARRPQLVVDPLTFWIAGVLGVLPALEKTFLSASSVLPNRQLNFSSAVGTIGHLPPREAAARWALQIRKAN